MNMYNKSVQLIWLYTYHGKKFGSIQQVLVYYPKHIAEKT